MCSPARSDSSYHAECGADLGEEPVVPQPDGPAQLLLLVPRPQVPSSWLIGYRLGFGTVQFAGLYLGMAAGFPAGLASTVVGIATTWLVLAERPTLVEVLGGLLIVGGVAWSGTSRSRGAAFLVFARRRRRGSVEAR